MDFRMTTASQSAPLSWLSRPGKAALRPMPSTQWSPSLPVGGQQYDAARRSPIRPPTNTIGTRLSGEDSGRERVAFNWEPANARRPDSHLANEGDEPPSISPGATLLSQTAFWPRRRLHAWARLFIPTEPTPQIARSYTFDKDEAIDAATAVMLRNGVALSPRE
ncbi:hypothetical protein CCHR01_04240 [Colletotrichum chrysophilum]|uniref:Uncharacterized protein n=1 Tax=Colletotrichum chrysophilum TaxID=1836956 RepID=A0AAD9ATT1_9PEZI|nr:hypothetical protein CCHR01_04240 [Colletotrichum chrysophilum]